MNAAEEDRYLNAILGTGMVHATLRAGGATVELTTDDDGNVTNTLLVKIPIGGPPQERGYLVTITIPEDTNG